MKNEESTNTDNASSAMTPRRLSSSLRGSNTQQQQQNHHLYHSHSMSSTQSVLAQEGISNQQQQQDHDLHIHRTNSDDIIRKKSISSVSPSTTKMLAKQRYFSGENLQSSPTGMMMMDDGELMDAESSTTGNAMDDDPLQHMEHTIGSLHTIIDKLSTLFKPLFDGQSLVGSSQLGSTRSNHHHSSSSLDDASLNNSSSAIGCSITRVEPQFGPISGGTTVTISILNTNTNGSATSPNGTPSSNNNSMNALISTPTSTTTATTGQNNIGGMNRTLSGFQKKNASSPNSSQGSSSERFKVLFGKQLIEPQSISLNGQSIVFATPAQKSDSMSSYEIRLLDLDDCQFVSSNPPISFTYLSDIKEQVLTDLNQVRKLYGEKGVALLSEKTFANGQTALHVAFRLARFEVVKYLVLQSDQFDCLVQTDDNGQTPFDIAMSHKHYLFLTQIIDWLKQVVKNKLQFQQQQLLNMSNPPMITTTTSSNSNINALDGSESSTNVTSTSSTTPNGELSLAIITNSNSGGGDATTTPQKTYSPTSDNAELTPMVDQSPGSSVVSDYVTPGSVGTGSNRKSAFQTPASSSVPTIVSPLALRNVSNLSQVTEQTEDAIQRQRSGHKRIATSSGFVRQSQEVKGSFYSNNQSPLINQSVLDDELSFDDETDTLNSSTIPNRTQYTLEEREEEAISNLIVKYRLDQYSDIYAKRLEEEDLLLEKITRRCEMKDWNSPNAKKRKETMLVPLTREKSYLEEVQLERRANPFKPSIYYDEEVDDGYTESALLLSQFYEDSAKQLPFHVLSTIQTMSSDFVIVTFKSLMNIKSKDLIVTSEDLRPITYEIDIVDRKKNEEKKEKKKNEEKRKKNLNLFKFSNLGSEVASPAIETDSPPMGEVDGVDVALVVPDKQKLIQLDGLQEPEFLLATFEDVFPCEDQQRVTYDDTKLLYSDFEWEASHIDPTTQYLFELKRFELDVNKKLEAPLEEVFFITVSLYAYTDKAYKKISEDVDFKVDPLAKETDSDDVNRIKAMFSVQKSIESKVVVLFKFYRKFRGELTEQLNDFYTQKAEKVKLSDVKKFLTKNEKLTTFPGISNTVSVFAWSAIHFQDCVTKNEVSLMDKLYVLPLKCKTGDATLLDNYLDVYTNAEDRESKPLMKKTLYGNMRFLLKELPSIPPIPRHYHPNSHELVVKLENKHLRVQHIPNLENNLLTKLLPLSSEMIIYPKELVLGKKEYKNIMVRVSFCSEKERNKPLNVFYSKFSRNPDRNARVPYRFTSVSVGNRTPEFSDEFKCILPCTLTGQHILYFEFLNVLHKESLILKNHREDVQRIGFAAHRILADQKVSNSEISLDIYTEKKENNVVKNEKIEGSFTVQLFWRSIAFPTDDNLSSFFMFIDNFQRKNGSRQGGRKQEPRSFFEELTNRELSTSLPGLKNLSIQHMAFAPVILNQLFVLYFDMYDEETQNNIFNTVIDMIDKYRTEHRTIVPGWIKFQFTSVFQEHVMPRLPIIATSVRHLLENPAYDSKVIKNAAYIFSILLKAMVVHLDYMKNKKQDEDYDFDDTFYATINTITTKSFRNLLKRNILSTRPVTIINTTVIFAQFLKVLFTIVDKPYVMKLIASFVELLPLIIPNDSEMDKKNKNSIYECVANLQIITYKEVFAYDNYLQLFIPESVESIWKQGVIPSLDGTHFLFSSFVDVIIKNIASSLKEIRNNTALIFREFIYKLLSNAKSPAFEGVPDVTDRVNLMTFEFVEKFLDVLQDWRAEVEKGVNLNKKTMNDCKKRKIMSEQQLAAKKEAQRSVNENALASFQVDILNKEIAMLETTIKQLDTMINTTKEDLRRDMKESFKEKRQLVACIFHILKNTDRNFVNKWLKQCSQNKKVQFLLLLQLMLQSFEYQSEDYYKVFYENHYNTQVKVKNKAHQSSELGALNSQSVQQQMNNSSHSIVTAYSESGDLIPPPTVSALALNISNNSTASDNSSDIMSPRRTSTGTSELVKAGNSLKSKNKQGFLSKLIPMIPGRFVSTEQNTKGDNSQYNQLKKRKSDNQEKTKSVKLETNGSLYVTKCLMIEQNWSREVSHFAFELLVYCIEDILQEKVEHPVEQSAFLENIVKTFLNFLRLNQPEDVLINVLTYLKCFFSKNYKSIFDEDTSTQYPTLFCECLMSLCNSTIADIRKHATAALYLLIRYMYIINYNTILKPQVLTTLALSKTLQKSGNLDSKDSPLVNITYLKNAIEAIGKYAYLDPEPPIPVNQTLNQEQELVAPKTEPSTKNLSTLDAFFRKIEQRVKFLSAVKERNKEESTFAEEVNTQVCKKLQSLLHDTTSVKTTLALQDIHKTEDLFLRISQVYTRIPELRFVWLNQLAGYHNKHEQYLEASQCYMTILSIVFENLKASNSPILNGVPVQNFFAISPLKRKSSVASARTNPANDCFISNQAAEFTEFGILSLISKAVECFELAEFFESSMILERLSIPFLERMGDWSRLSTTYHHLQDLCDRLKKPDRLEPYYYKVQLVGFPTDKQQPEQFIYKMPKLFKLFKMNKWVQDKFGSPQNPVEVISGAKKVNLIPNKRYVFLTPVKPLTKSIKQTVIGNQKISKYEGNIKKFYYESTHGKKTELVTEIHKKKVIITTNDYFPSLKTRLLIESEEEIILTPIEAAIENIDSQITKLKESLQIPGDEDLDSPNISQIKIGNNIDLSNLQLVLQGSIKATVQGGPASIVEGFLKIDQRPLYSLEHIITLNRKCHIFLQLCEEAVKIENQLMDKATERAFHQEMEKALAETQQLFAQHLTPLDEMFYANPSNPQSFYPNSPEDGDAQKSVIGDIPVIRNFRFSMPQHELSQLGLNLADTEEEGNVTPRDLM